MDNEDRRRNIGGKEGRKISLFDYVGMQILDSLNAFWEVEEYFLWNRFYGWDGQAEGFGSCKVESWGEKEFIWIFGKQALIVEDFALNNMFGSEIGELN